MAKIPPEEHQNWLSYLKGILPGTLTCFVLGASALWIDAHLIPEQLMAVNYVIVAIAIGLVLRNVFGEYIIALEEGITFSARVCLFIGIVLLGARMNLVEIFEIGSSALIMVAISITLSITIAGYLAKKYASNERWGHLVGVGLGVCGVSAVMATAPAIRAKRREIVTAIGAALMVDVMVLVALPTLAGALGWSDALAGYTAGGVSANTAQCIAIGHAHSPAAGAIAAIVKSARNALMPVVVLVLTYVYTRRGMPTGDDEVNIGLLWKKFPKFVVGLIIAAAFTTAGLVTPEGAEIAAELTTWFFVTCFVAIGAGIDINQFEKKDLAVIAIALPTSLILWIYVYTYATNILGVV